jgi:Leucine-rich repeat (LRR) protein
LFYCVDLNTLTLRNNELEEIPSAIGALVNLTHLDLSRNSIATLPDNIKTCRHLQFLDLSSNSLYKIPESITTLFNLTNLQLNDTGLDFLPANFGRLVNLKILELRDNQLITLPKTMGRLQNLQRLDIGENEFTELPEIVGQLVALVELWIDNNRIRRLSANIGNLKKLVHFDATNNMLPELPAEVGQWTRMQEMCLTGNELNTLPVEIGKLKNLFNLKVDENQLQSLPDTIGNLVSLEELMLSHNDLIALPSPIGLLRRLKILTCDENLLHCLPDDITSCINLSVLSVRGNKLTKIPADIGHMANLKVLNIVNNFIHQLPVSILNLQKLGALWISDNQSEPLIPLQKEYQPDGNIGLTCFMLPQTVQQRGADQTGGYMYDTSKSQFVTGVQENAGIRGGTTTKHICFAPPIPNGDIDVDDDIAGSPNKRLLRSPTPYPKELHVLNKYAKNLQKQMHLQNSDADESALYAETSVTATVETPHNTTPSRLNPQIEIREAKVTSNNLINRQQANEYEMSDMRLMQRADEQMEDEVSPLLNGDDEFGSSSAKIYSQYDRLAHYSKAPNRKPETVTTRLLNGVDEFDSVSMQMQRQPAYLPQHYVNGHDMERPFSSTSFTSQPTTELMSFDHGANAHLPRSRISSAPTYENSRLNTPTPSMLSSQNSISNTSQRLMPPPYEIAKIFSKKTSAEYEIYDEIRSKQRLQQVEPPSPGVNVPITNGFLHTDPMDLPSPTPQQQPQPSPLPLSNGYEEPEQNLNSYNNNVFDSGRHSIATDMSELSVTTTTDVTDGKRADMVDSNDDVSQKSSSVATTPVKTSDKDSLNNNKQTTSPEKKKWVFGLHKNPKVVSN